MKTSTCLFLVIGLFLSQGDLNGAPPESAGAKAPPQGAVSTEHYLSKIIVRTKDGKFSYGLLVGVEKDQLIMKEGASETRVALEDLAEVIIDRSKNPKAFMISGLIAGTFAWNIIGVKAKNQPMAYLEANDGTVFSKIFWNGVFGSAGMGLGYLASFFERGQEKFAFDTGNADRLAKWEELKGYLARGPRQKELHLSIQSGHVFTAVSHRYEKAFTDAGYNTSGGFDKMSPGSDSDGYGKFVSRATGFNLLRKAQLTVSLKSKFDVGAAVVFSSEPGVGGHDAAGRRVWQTYDATGYYAVGVYKPLSGSVPKTIRWSVGLGLGASRVDFELGAYSQGGYPDYIADWAQQEIAQTIPSGMAFTELSFFFGPNTSLGLIADYVFGPTRNILSFPEWDVSGQRIRMGNASIGASFGMHF